MVRKRKKSKSAGFYNIFVGEYVELTTLLPYSESAQNMEQAQSISTFLKRAGYLLDIDEAFYYIGETPNSVSRAIRIEQVAEIAIAKQKTIEDEILDEFNPDGPEN